MLYLMCVTLFILIIIIADTINRSSTRQTNRMKVEGNPDLIVKWKCANTWRKRYGS
jgi:hypothetical protein